MILPRQFGLLSVLLVFLFLAGCGRDVPSTSQSEAEPEANNSPAAEDPQDSSEPDTSAAPEPAVSGRNRIQERDGTKWIDDIPLDVWYDDPLAVAGTAGEVEQPAQIEDSTPTTSAPDPMPMPMEKETAGGTDWQRIIPAELLDAEVTSIRNRFNADLQTVGSYNNSYLSIPPHVATLTALSHIAEDHPGDIRWKENSPYVKHLAGQMIAEPLRRGPSSQRPLKEKFDNIVEILNGSVPATLDAPPEEEPIAELVEMADIMKRLENASKQIRVNGGTAEAMKSNAKQINQEAAVLGALTQVLLDGYGFEGDEGFEKFVKDMVDATVEARENVQDDKFDEFELSVSKIFQACQQCHSEYRG